MWTRQTTRRAVGRRRRWSAHSYALVPAGQASDENLGAVSSFAYANSRHDSLQTTAAAEAEAAERSRRPKRWRSTAESGRGRR
jgi:hypothetical protein